MRLGDKPRAEKWLRRACVLEEDFLYARVTLIQMWPATELQILSWKMSTNNISK